MPGTPYPAPGKLGAFAAEFSRDSSTERVSTDREIDCLASLLSVELSGGENSPASRRRAAELCALLIKVKHQAVAVQLASGLTFSVEQVQALVVNLGDVINTVLNRLAPDLRDDIVDAIVADPRFGVDALRSEPKQLTYQPLEN